MKQILLYAPMALLVLASCGANQTTLTENQVQAKVDSLVGVRMEELSRHYMEDLEKRIAIEVKVKADSIVAAREQEGK
jgi:polyhydroxyalkanoate synthesis regulator phasin